MTSKGLFSSSSLTNNNKMTTISSTSLTCLLGRKLSNYLILLFTILLVMIIMNDNISISSRVMGQCSGVSSTSPNVCSSHGLCVSNKCKCYDFSSQNTIISDTSGILKRNYLAQGEQLVSTNSRFQLSLNASGVVVISDLLNSNAIISTTPALANGFSSPFQLRLSSTGSLEIYGNNVLALSLTSNPVGSAPFRFLMQNNGDAILLGKGESIYYRTSNRILTTEGITWTGTNCADYSCFGVLASNSSVVCGGVGQCLSPNVCQCPNGTYGNTCERYCYGLYYTNKNVCSGKGSCIANDTCSCLAGYSGNSCTDYSCNGILYNESTNPLLCNGKGSCVSPNLCSCSAGYYGNNCETFYCQGKLYNNTGVCSGKGDCKSPDVCQCQSGYSGSDCSQYSCFGVAHDSTNTLPCNGHGSCISPDKCSCASGYFGESCDMFSCSSILKNETSIVCSGNGTCIGLDQCQCKSGYSGNNCEDYKCGGISFNQSGVCSGNGSCIAPETCVCAPGYYGNNCELFDCFDILFNNDSSCSGNGDCISPNTCSCLNGFYGETCSEFDCFNIPKNETGLVCSGNGTCQLPDQCNCKPGYEGLKCETFYCYGSISSDSNACNGNGYCVAPDDCICKEGYSGSTCGDHYCFGIAANSTGVLPCSGHGVCSKPNQCLCSNGYMGEECETFKCFDILKNESASCSSNGTCIGPDNCTCFEGHEGTACEIYKCYGVLPSNGDVCSGNGLCVGPNQCMCFEGYSGSLCDIYTCFGTIFNSTEPQPCSGKGTCQSPDHCQCLDGYLGENCETFKCFGILKNETSSVCSGNGTCSGPDQCICNSGYESTSCESYRCYGILFNESNVCSSNGYCVKPNDCVCSPQYYGDECNKFSCFGFSSNDSTIVCSGHGSCNDADKCECFSGYLGETCFRFKCFEIFENETNIVCSGNGTCIGPDQCQCKSGYSGNNCEEYKCGGISFNQSGVCSGKGSCFSPDSCLCEEGYYGNNCELFDCFGILFNNTVTLPCSSNGVCISPNTCSCSNGFYGETCSEFDCFSIPKNETGLVCSGNGTCQLPDQCNCKPGYEGLKCESYRCGGTLFNDSSVCNGKGSCISSEVCSCYEGYSGISCSEFSCYGNFNSSTVSMPCSGNGSCIMPDKCICNENYYGDECQYFNCFGSLFSDAGNVCSGHGTCDRPDYCSCFAGYFGNNCSLFKCANYLSNETNACSGKGICFAPDSCLCSDGYTGENCEKFSCFGKVFNNATDLPCHGKGSCIAPDTCTCNSGYFGNECDQFKCFNILQNDTGLVCSGNGICTSLDQCNCSQGFEGAKCNLFKCYNRLFNDSSVCSGNGVCVQPDQCQCNEGHNGPLCNNYYCFGIASNSTNILPCSGKGVCEAPDQCLCNSGFFGSKCDSFKCFGEEFNNTNVCSGRGQCIAPDQCTCNINYEGSNCENFKCFSKLNNDSTTCSGNGQCIDFDKCHCNTNWFGINCSVTSCFNKLSNDTSVCSGSGSCKQPNTCSCKQDYYGENCEVFKCFSHLSNQTDIVCGGKGSCVGLNNCTCRDGFVSKDCSVNIQPFNISLPKVSDTTYKSSDPYTVEIISALGGLNVSWYCMNCIAKSASSNLKVGKVGNSKSLAITTSELKAGTYLFAVNATMPNILPFPARISNTLYFELTIIDMNTPQVQTIGLPNVFLSKSSQELSAVVSSVVLNQSIIDGFLNCSANCTVTVSYSWAITTFNGLSITEEGVTNAINLGDNKIVLSPPIQLSSQLSSINGSVTFSFNLTNLQSTIGSTVEIPVVTAPNPPSINGQIIGTNTSISNLMRVMPSEGIALTDIFTIIIIEWSADPRLSPLTYAVGFLDNHDNPIQVTEFTTSTRISIYLPYIKSLKSSTKTRSLEENSLEPIQLVVFVKDSEGNIDWLQSATVYLAPFNGTTSELLDRLNVLYGTSTSVIAMFDQSYLVLGSSDLTLQLIKNITIDPKNPSAALATLNSLTSDLSSVSSAVVIEINNKLTSFISSIDSIYVDEKQQYGFVKSKLKAADVTTTVGISSNLLASGLEADGTKYVVSNLSSTILKGEIPKIITSQTNLDSVSIRTTLIDLAVASFKLMTANQLNQTLLSGNNSVVVNISSILETYNGFAKDCGLTLITYNKNTNFDNSTGRVASNINDFKFIQDSLTLPLQSLQNPISLTFALVESIEKILVNLKMESSNKTSNDSTLQLVKYEEIFSCKYWDETDRLWSSRGCSLKSVDVSSRTISCSCDHTTMFTTFVEQNSTFAKNVKDQVSALYGVQIGFGVVYTVIATGILIGLFILRNEQPVSSRLFTPYFGMVALIMESILIYIIQRSILANQLMNSSPEVWEQGDSVANIIANVVAIVVNTLNLTAILCYVIQVSRFQLMKYLHQLMASSRGNEEKSEKTLMILRYITSPTLSFSILTSFGFINVIYWLFWVMLRRLNAIEPATYTYIVSISYTVCILTFSVLISCVVVLDFLGSSYKQIQNSKMKRTNLDDLVDNPNTSFRKDKVKFSQVNIRNLLTDFVVSMDGPLYFRMEMLMYLVCFTFLILNQGIGLSSLPFRYESVESFKKALLIDGISFIFEVLYVISYIFVFGGYALIVALNYKYKKWKKHRDTNIEKRSSMEQEELWIDINIQEIFATPEGIQIFETFCVKEFSTENLYLYLDCLAKKDVCKGENMKELPELMSFVFNNYIKNGAPAEVNIPSNSRNSFLYLFRAVLELKETFRSSTTSLEENLSTDLQSLSKELKLEKANEIQVTKQSVTECFDLLERNLLINIGDTFSRFIHTPEFRVYKKAKELQNILVERTNIVYGI